jgi:hypothetical protein
LVVSCDLPKNCGKFYSYLPPIKGIISFEHRKIMENNTFKKGKKAKEQAFSKISK